MYRQVLKVLMVLQYVDFQTKELQYKACINYGKASCSRSHIQRNNKSQLSSTETVSDRGCLHMLGLTQRAS